MSGSYLLTSNARKIKINGPWAKWSPTSRRDSLLIFGLPISLYSKAVWHFLSSIQRDWPGDPTSGYATASQREIAECMRLNVRYVNGAISQLYLWGLIEKIGKGVYKLEKIDKQLEAKSVYTEKGKSGTSVSGTKSKQKQVPSEAQKVNDLASNLWTNKDKGTLGAGKKAEVPYRSEKEYWKLFREDPKGLPIEDMKLADEAVWESTGIGPHGESKSNLVVEDKDARLRQETLKDRSKENTEDIIDFLGI